MVGETQPWVSVAKATFPANQKKTERFGHWGGRYPPPAAWGREIRPPPSRWGWLTGHHLSLSLDCRGAGELQRTPPLFVAISVSLSLPPLSVVTHRSKNRLTGFQQTHGRQDPTVGLGGRPGSVFGSRRPAWIGVAKIDPAFFLLFFLWVAEN
jgi:hypothetical protein